MALMDTENGVNHNAPVRRQKTFGANAPGFFQRRVFKRLVLAPAPENASRKMRSVRQNPSFVRVDLGGFH